MDNIICYQYKRDGEYYFLKPVRNRVIGTILKHYICDGNNWHLQGISEPIAAWKIKQLHK